MNGGWRRREQAPCGGGSGTEPSLPGPSLPQPNPRPADTHGSWWDGGLGSLEAEEDNGEMLWCWVVVWLGWGERAVHRAPSPASSGGPQLIQIGGSQEQGGRTGGRGEGRPGRGGRGKEKMEERRGDRRGGSKWRGR